MSPLIRNVICGTHRSLLRSPLRCFIVSDIQRNRTLLCDILTFFCVYVRAIGPWAVHHSSNWAGWRRSSSCRRTGRASRPPSCPSGHRVRLSPTLTGSPRGCHRSFVHCSRVPFGSRTPNPPRCSDRLCGLYIDQNNSILYSPIL